MAVRMIHWSLAKITLSGAASGTEDNVLDVVRSRGGTRPTRSLLVNLDGPFRRVDEPSNEVVDS
jgi:hypothetical protein